MKTCTMSRVRKQDEAERTPDQPSPFTIIISPQRLRRLWLHKHRSSRLLEILLQKLMMEAVKSKLQTVRDSQLVVNFAQIILNHLLSRTNLISDLFIAHATRNATDNRKFFLRELRLHLRISQRSGLCTISLDYPADRLVIDPRLAIRDLTNTLHQQIRRDRTRNDAAHAPAIQFNGIGLVSLNYLNDKLCVWRLPDKLRHRVDGSGNQLPFHQHHVRRKALECRVKMRQ